MKNNKIPVNYNGKFSYNIVLESSFEALPDEVEALEITGRKVCIVTDSNVQPLYADKVAAAFKGRCSEVYIYVFPAGEENKNLDEIRKLYSFLIENKFDRKDMLAALGGGVTGDMTGFTAATYLRGIRFIQIPTTLLSQVDSSIGGKTGVDFEAYKNMVGAFYMPSLVYINTEVLATLPQEQFESGMGEVVKHGLIADEEYYEYLLDHMSEIAERDPAVMGEVVKGSCRIKRAVVEQDPTEKGLRAILNFGHTIGHAVEKAKNFELPHGWCVSIGAVAAAYISFKKGVLDETDFFELRDMMVGFGLPITFDSASPEEILENTKHDKKVSAGHVRVVLLDRIGHAVLSDDVTDEELLAGIRYVCAEEGMMA